jgi:uncharacterized membrane-anchored protein
MTEAPKTNVVQEILTKVPAVTLGFWIIKIIATTLGETGGDTVSMTWLGETTPDADKMGVNGYLVGTAIFAAALIVFVALQVRAKRFNRWLYWATIVASTTAGTTLADFCDRSLGIGYLGGSLILFGCVLASLLVWRLMLGSVSVNTVVSPRQEIFYWITITFSQTLGTALGDWASDSESLGRLFAGFGVSGPLGYLDGALMFGAGLLILAILFYATKISRVFLFWAAFILTRPLGATLGDFFDKTPAEGGVGVSRPIATLILVIAIVVLVAVVPQRAGRHPGSEPATA